MITRPNAGENKKGSRFAKKWVCDPTTVRARHGDGGVIPGNGGVIPGDGGVISGDGGVISGDGGVVSGNGGVVSGNGGVVSGDGGVVSGNGGVVSGDGGVVSKRRGSCSKVDGDLRAPSVSTGGAFFPVVAFPTRAADRGGDSFLAMTISLLSHAPRLRWLFAAAAVVVCAAPLALRAQDAAEAKREGQPPAALAQQAGDWTHDAPGTKHRVDLGQLPPTFATNSSVNGPELVPRPANAKLQVPPGFKIEEYARGLQNPRYLLTAPDGDTFVAETGANKILVLRDTRGGHAPDVKEVFSSDALNKPFGLAFYPPGPNPQFLYAANTDGVVRFPYKNGDLKATGPGEKLPARIRGGGGHSTRALVFSPDGKKLYVTVGSGSNVDERNREEERDRALVWEMKPDGTDQKVFGYGIRNPVGIAIRPGTEEVWVSTNERDGLGDDLVPDYVTRVVPGGFYGWPWYFMGNHPDPRKQGMHPELADKVLVPDVPVQSHSASLNLTFYTGSQFPAAYRGDAFAAFHGSWNRAKRTGYKIVRVPIDKDSGKARGDYEDFVTGFVNPDGNVWGRPVGVAVARDGSLLFSEDAEDIIWRVSYAGG